MIRTCNQFKLCGGVIQHKTKPNQAPSVWHREVSILKACFPSTVAFYQEVCGIFFFFKEKCSKRGKQETQRCPCSLGKALGGHLEMLLAVGKGGRWAVQACPLHACSCVWKPNSEPSPDV